MSLNLGTGSKKRDSLFRPRVFLGILYFMFRSLLLIFLLLYSPPIHRARAEPSPVPSVNAEAIPKKEIRKIRREFTQVLDNERDALRTEQTRKKREGDTSRRLRKRAWDGQERVALRKYFAENSHGPERRSYVQQFTARRSAFYEQLKAEERQERSDLDIRWKALKESQRTRLTTVEEILKRGERPAPRLLEHE
jgi:membrane protein involved in colicin uptake